MFRKKLKQVICVALIFLQFGCRSEYLLKLTSRPPGATVHIGSDIYGTTPCEIEISKDCEYIEDHHIDITYALPDGRRITRNYDLRKYEPPHPIPEFIGYAFAFPGFLFVGLCIALSDDDEEEDDAFSYLSHNEEDDDDDDDSWLFGLIGIGLMSLGVLVWHVFGVDTDSVGGYDIYVTFDDINDISIPEELPNGWEEMGINQKQAEFLQSYIDSENEWDEPDLDLSVREENIRVIHSDIFDSLFPSLIFVHLPFESDPSESIDNSSDGYRYKVIAMDELCERIYVFYSWGDHEEFASFLRDQSIKVNSAEDAEMIWNAFCHIYHKDWNGSFLQIDSNTWRLGYSSDEDTKEDCFYLLELSGDNTVLNGRLKCETIETTKIR